MKFIVEQQTAVDKVFAVVFTLTMHCYEDVLWGLIVDCEVVYVDFVRELQKDETEEFDVVIDR